MKNIKSFNENQYNSGSILDSYDDPYDAIGQIVEYAIDDFLQSIKNSIGEEACQKYDSGDRYNEMELQSAMDELARKYILKQFNNFESDEDDYDEDQDEWEDEY